MATHAPKSKLLKVPTLNRNCSHDIHKYSTVISVIETIPYLYTTTLVNTTEAYSEMLSNANIEVMMWV